MAIERTFSIIKPDATTRNLTGAINALIEKAGLRIVAQKRIRMTREQAETFYAVHKARPFFGELVEFMISARGGHATFFISPCTSRRYVRGPVRSTCGFTDWRLCSGVRGRSAPCLAICRLTCRFISYFLANRLLVASARTEGDVVSRAGGNRTPNRRFWRPVLYQLSYARISLRAKPLSGLRFQMDRTTHHPKLATPHTVAPQEEPTLPFPP